MSVQEEYLIPPYKMNNNACISKIDEPIWLIKPESSQEVSRSRIPKSCITESSAGQVKERRDADRYC